MSPIDPTDQDLLSIVIPQFFPAHWLEEAPDLVFTEFPSRIRIGYVRRIEGAYCYLMRPALEELGVSVPALHESAIRNLGDLPVNGLTVGKTPGGSEVFLRDVNDNFRAVRILLPNVHAAIVDEVGEEYFAAIPCRDWFFAWSKNQASKWQQRNIASAMQHFLNDDYSLSTDIFCRSATGFSVFLTQDVSL